MREMTIYLTMENEINKRYNIDDILGIPDNKSIMLNSFQNQPAESKSEIVDLMETPNNL